MSYSLFLDPGLRHCGVALFEGDTLFRAWLSKNSDRKGRGALAWESMAQAVQRDWLRRCGRRGVLLHTLCCEVPQVYRGGGKGDPDDLLQLAGVVGAVASAVPAGKRLSYYPREWKGSTPKEIHNERVLKVLCSAEHKRIDAPSNGVLHNVLDSIGLGLFFHGRMKRIAKNVPSASGFTGSSQ